MLHSISTKEANMAQTNVGCFCLLLFFCFVATSAYQGLKCKKISGSSGELYYRQNEDYIPYTPVTYANYPRDYTTSTPYYSKPWYYTSSNPYYTRPRYYTTPRPSYRPNYSTESPYNRNYTSSDSDYTRPWYYTSSNPYYTRPWYYTSSNPYYTRPWYYTSSNPYYTRPWYYTSSNPYYTRPWYHTTYRPNYSSNRPYYTTQSPYNRNYTSSDSDYTRPWYHTSSNPYYTRPWYYTSSNPYYTRPWYYTSSNPYYTRPWYYTSSNPYYTRPWYQSTPYYTTYRPYYTTQSPYDPVSRTRCWIIEVPEDSYVKLQIRKLILNNYEYCSRSYLKIAVDDGKDEIVKFCPNDYYSQKHLPLTAFNDVNITFGFNAAGWMTSYIAIQYSIESLDCAKKNHFRCSANECIHQHQVCNGVRDCTNGADEFNCDGGVAGVYGMNETRENAIAWLKEQRSTAFGWGKNTHRAVTALHLARPYSFLGNYFEEELMVKQLELQTSVALLRNSTNPISVNDLSMFINALTVTCHNPRSFYGYDLVQILADRITTEKSPSPSALLTLCNLNWTIPESGFERLVNIMYPEESNYPFHLDVTAVAIMAFACAKTKSRVFAQNPEMYYRKIEEIIAGQLSDGSFGNVYTTALVTQALVASGQQANDKWDVSATARYLMVQLNSTNIDFLSACLALPVMSGRSLVDIGKVDCSDSLRKQREGDEISDLTNKLGGKNRIKYSLYIGDEKDVIHRIDLRMPENSSAYDVMTVAQVADPKFKFLHRDVAGQMYVYQIAGITNDPEIGMFWLLYTKESHVNGTLISNHESADEVMLGENEHLIMWYRTADI